MSLALEPSPRSTCGSGYSKLQPATAKNVARRNVTAPFAERLPKAPRTLVPYFTALCFSTVQTTCCREPRPSTNWQDRWARLGKLVNVLYMSMVWPLAGVWFWIPSGHFPSGWWYKHREMWQCSIQCSVLPFFPYWALVLYLALLSNPHTKLMSGHHAHRFPDSPNVVVFISLPLLYESRNYTSTRSRAWLSKCKERRRKRISSQAWPLFCPLLCYHRRYRCNYFIFKTVPM